MMLMGELSCTPSPSLLKAEPKIKPDTQALVQFLLTHTHAHTHLDFTWISSSCLIKSETTKNCCEITGFTVDCFNFRGKGKDASKASDDWSNPPVRDIHSGGWGGTWKCRQSLREKVQGKKNKTSYDFTTGKASTYGVGGGRIILIWASSPKYSRTGFSSTKKGPRQATTAHSMFSSTSSTSVSHSLLTPD